MNNYQPKVLEQLIVFRKTPVPWGAPSPLYHAVGIAAIDDGLFVGIPPYINMALGDQIDVYWGNNNVPDATAFVTAENLNQLVLLNLPRNKFYNGMFTPFYRVTRISSLIEDSPVQNILVKLDIPGGLDPDPSTSNINERLTSPNVLSVEITPEIARLGVDVTVLPYLKMADYDRLCVSWGGLIIEHIVQPHEVDLPITIKIDEETILRAGDGDVLVMYQVIDAAQNPSMGWSMSTSVNVSASGHLLMPPIVKGAVGGELVLTSDDVIVQVIAIAPDFAIGNTISLLWAGSTAEGVPVDWTGHQTVTSLPLVMEFAVPNETVAAISQGVARVSYDLITNTEILPSQRVNVHILADAAQFLRPTTVAESVNGVLPVNAAQATVTITPYAGMAAGDLVTLDWKGTKSNGEQTQYNASQTVSCDMVDSKITFIVPATEFSVLDGGFVDIRYIIEPASSEVPLISSWQRLSVRNVTIILPAPIVLEAHGFTLTTSDVLYGGTLYIDAAGAFKAGDLVTISCVGKPGFLGSPEFFYIVTPSDEGQALTLKSKLPVQTVGFNEGHGIDLSYEIKRTSGNVDKSLVSHYDIPPTIGHPLLKVMGARSSVSFLPPGDLGRVLTALNIKTLELQEAQWWYEGDTTKVSGPMFRDSEPSRLLHVSAADDEVILNVANLCGASYSMALLRDEGTVRMVGHEDVEDANAAAPVPVAHDLVKIIEVVATKRAFAARRADGSVIAWGDVENGGSVPSNIASLTDIVSVIGSRLDVGIDDNQAFAALRSNGAVVAWGNKSDAGDVPPDIAKRTDLVKLIGGGNAFAALTNDGHIVAWGGGADGGDVPQNIAKLDDIVAAVGNSRAFAARRANGSVVSWGNDAFGGVMPPEVSSLLDIVEIIPSEKAFCARRANGSVVAWGLGPTSNVPTEIANLMDIVEVVGSRSVFVARRANNSVVAWGDSAYGGTVPPGLAKRTDIISVVCNNRACAILHKDGSVSTWGDPLVVGAASHEVISDLLSERVMAIYPFGEIAFSALRSDLSAVHWGYLGGNMGGLLTDMSFSYEVTP